MYKLLDQKTNGNCLHCGKELYGRSDKKFCGAQCRNAYHNDNMKIGRKQKEGIVNSLYKNYNILNNIIKTHKNSADIWDLERIGYRSTLVTGFHLLRNHAVDCYCFDIAFRQRGNRLTRIRKTEMFSVLFRNFCFCGNSED